MEMCKGLEGYLLKEGVLEEHFPYVTRGLKGEFIIPEGKLDDFVLKYQELSDKRDHLERLKLYRAEGVRPDPDAIDD